MPTALELKPEEWRKFKPARNITARLAQGGSLNKRREKALEVAKQAASLLRQQFGTGTDKVVIFGSVVNKEGFTSWSDIDLAVWGMEPDDLYLAVAAATGLSPLFKVDLVEPNTCRETIKKAIQNEGIEI